MAKKIRIEVNAQELAYIAEALECFINDCRKEGADIPGADELFERIQERHMREEGEPEEGY